MTTCTNFCWQPGHCSAIGKTHLTIRLLDQPIIEARYDNYDPLVLAAPRRETTLKCCPSLNSNSARLMSALNISPVISGVADASSLKHATTSTFAPLSTASRTTSLRAT